VLHGPHHRFLDLRFREREFTAAAEAGDDLMGSAPISLIRAMLAFSASLKTRY
jgi:hypothetical protein